ncbi:MAG: hypothetical protein QXX57_01510 [Nitrososphaerota archaeon]
MRPSRSLVCNGSSDPLGRELHVENVGYIFSLITQRTVNPAKSGIFTNYWLLAVDPETIYSSTGLIRRGLDRNGVLVRVVSATSPEGVWELGIGRRKPFEGVIKVVEGNSPTS